MPTTWIVADSCANLTWDNDFVTVDTMGPDAAAAGFRSGARPRGDRGLDRGTGTDAALAGAGRWRTEISPWLLGLGVFAAAVAAIDVRTSTAAQAALALASVTAPGARSGRAVRRCGAPIGGP